MVASIHDDDAIVVDDVSRAPGGRVQHGLVNPSSFGSRISNRT